MINPPPGLSHATLDASFVIGLCAKEPGKYVKASVELRQRVLQGVSLHAPQLLIMECAYVLCGKLQAGVLTSADHAIAVANLHSLLTLLDCPTTDASLLARAEQIRAGYGCSRSADSLYLALAEQWASFGPSELLTFDAGQQAQAHALNLPIIVMLLIP